MVNHNIEAAVLSSVLFDPMQIYLLQTLDEQDFTNFFYRAVFNAIMQLEKEEKNIDEITIRAKLAQMGKYNEEDFLDLLSVTPIANIEEYINLLKEYRAKRELHKLATSIPSLLQEQSSDELCSIITKKVENIQQNTYQKEISISDLAISLEKEMEKAREKGDFIGFKTGIAPLDGIIGAFAPGDLVIIGARPSMGKTALAATIANYASKNGGVLFDSLEMSALNLFRRIVAIRSGEDIVSLKRGLIKKFSAYKKALDSLQKENLHIQDESHLPIEKLKAKAIRKIRKHKIHYWFIDHLRFIKKKDPCMTHIEVGEITKTLKKVAKEEGVVVILLSQLNRESNNRIDKRPTLADLRDSGAVEEDADIVLLLHRESYYKKEKNAIEPDRSPAEIIVAKNRDGRTGVAKCVFNAPCARFEKQECIIEKQYEIPAL